MGRPWRTRWWTPVGWTSGRRTGRSGRSGSRRWSSETGRRPGVEKGSRSDHDYGDSGGHAPARTAGGLGVPGRGRGRPDQVVGARGFSHPSSPDQGHEPASEQVLRFEASPLSGSPEPAPGRTGPHGDHQPTAIFGQLGLEGSGIPGAPAVTRIASKGASSGHPTVPSPTRSRTFSQSELIENILGLVRQLRDPFHREDLGRQGREDGRLVPASGPDLQDPVRGLELRASVMTATM